MQATTSGVTRKIDKFYNNDFIKDFIQKEKLIFDEIKNSKQVLYNDKEVISDPALNYINLLPCDPGSECLKNVILSEYRFCDNVYPYLGDYFLHKLFDDKIKLGKTVKFDKREQKKNNSINNNEIRTFGESKNQNNNKFNSRRRNKKW